jgi:hypothetical protein
MHALPSRALSDVVAILLPTALCTRTTMGVILSWLQVRPIFTLEKHHDESDERKMR